LVTFYETSPSAWYARIIEQVYDDGVIRLDEPVSASVVYSLGSTSIPFAVLETQRVLEFDQYAQYLENWLKLEVLKDRYYTDLNRLIQPLLINENPTDSQVGAAEQRLKDLMKVLIESMAVEQNVPGTSLEALLSTYESPNVPEADALVRAFKEKGADRAVDLLLECQFSTFFGLTQDETSYAGNFQKNLRDVARLDMPVRKVGRVQEQRVIAEIETPDFEYDDSDLDPDTTVDPPISL
jgi:hypothetical protein